MDGADDPLIVIVGAVLGLMGVVADVPAAAAGLTALIPSLVGVPPLACAVAAQRRHPLGMHAALSWRCSRRSSV